jgi:hypothetical protein
LKGEGWWGLFQITVVHADNCPYARGEVKDFKLTLRWLTENRGKLDRVLDWKIGNDIPHTDAESEEDRLFRQNNPEYFAQKKR